jgi:hypothetical protein
VDPALRSQLAASSGKWVEAVLTLRPEEKSAEPPQPAEVEGRVERVLDRVAEETGIANYESNVFGFLGSFAVAAAPKFLERLIAQPEVESATANRPGDSGLGGASG